MIFKCFVALSFTLFLKLSAFAAISPTNYKLWERGDTIKFKLINPTSSELDDFIDSMEAISRYSGIRYLVSQNIGNHDANYIVRFNEDEHSASMGKPKRKGNKLKFNFNPRYEEQRLVIERDGRVGKRPFSTGRVSALRKTVILHELMHVMGFAHEHERTDAPRSLPKSENISPSRSRRFALTQYDPYSVTHYNFTGHQVMIPYALEKQLGILSVLDRVALSRLYGGDLSLQEARLDYEQEKRLILEEVNFKVSQSNCEFLMGDELARHPEVHCDRQFPVAYRYRYGNKIGYVCERGIWVGLNQMLSSPVCF